MYDRRIDGEGFVFGNQGALYMNAMTWWDHETDSVWSQVTGDVLFGPLEGTRLEQIPAAVETWGAWRQAHPETLVLETPGGFEAQPIDPDFVVGVRIGDDAAGYRFEHVVERTVLNDAVGEVPIAVYAQADHLIRVWSRTVDDAVVKLEADGNRLVDPATGTVWNAVTGQGVSGPLAGRPLPPVAWASSFDWAWEDFHSGARIVG